MRKIRLERMWRRETRLRFPTVRNLIGLHKVNIGKGISRDKLDLSLDISNWFLAALPRYNFVS